MTETAEQQVPPSNRFGLGRDLRSPAANSVEPPAQDEIWSLVLSDGTIVHGQQVTAAHAAVVGGLIGDTSMDRLNPMMNFDALMMWLVVLEADHKGTDIDTELPVIMQTSMMELLTRLR